MTYINTVIDCLTNHPHIYLNRLSVDNRLFGGYGTGYEWVNGQIIDTIRLIDLYPDKESIDEIIEIYKDENDYVDEEIPQNLMNRYTDYSFKILDNPSDDLLSEEEKERKAKLKKSLSNISKEELDRRINEALEILDEVLEEEGIQVEKDNPSKDTNNKFHFSDICQYSNICKIPDDIKDDWLCAIDKYVDFCLAYIDRLFIISHNKETQIGYLQQARKRIDNIKAARK